MFIAASVSQLQRETQTCWNLWRPNLNLPRILFNTNNPPIHTYTTAVLYFLWKQVAVREQECLNVCVFISACVGTVYIHTHMLVSVCSSDRPAIWLDPQRGCGSVTFTFRWRFSLSAVPCCYWCSNVGRHGWLPGPLIHTPGGKLLNPTDSTICLSNCSLSLYSTSLYLSPFVWLVLSLLYKQLNRLITELWVW